MTFFNKWLKIFERSILRTYIDAGTGSLLIQLIIGSAAGGFLMLKIYWSSLKGWIMHRHPEKGTDEEQSEHLVEQ